MASTGTSSICKPTCPLSPPEHPAPFHLQPQASGVCNGRSVTVAAAPVATQAGTASGPKTGGKKKVKKLVDINGEVTKDLGNGMFQIKLENGVSVMAHLSGKIRQNRIKIVTGDKVQVSVWAKGFFRGRIGLQRGGSLGGCCHAMPCVQCNPTCGMEHVVDRTPIQPPLSRQPEFDLPCPVSCSRRWSCLLMT